MAISMQTLRGKIGLQTIYSASAEAQKINQRLVHFVCQSLLLAIEANRFMDHRQTLITPGTLLMVQLGMVQIAHHVGQVAPYTLTARLQQILSLSMQAR
jgi:hypothetical protein